MLLATSDNPLNLCHLFMPSPHESPLAAPELRVWPERLHENEVLFAGNNNALHLRNLCLSFFYELPMAAAVSRLRAQGLQFTVLLLEANYDAVPNNLFSIAFTLRNFCSTPQNRPLVCCAKRGGHPKIFKCQEGWQQIAGVGLASVWNGCLELLLLPGSRIGFFVIGIEEREEGAEYFVSVATNR